MFRHCNSENVARVGAGFYKNTPAFSELIIEDFSSARGTPIFFYSNGMRRSKPVIRQQPHFTGPNDLLMTFFSAKGPDGKFRSFGTSASAPHVAAVTALML
jgi:hypothetical protein